MPPLRLTPPTRCRAVTEARRRAAIRGDDRSGEIERCRADPAYFTDEHLVIDDAQDLGGGSAGTMRFRLWPDQRDLFRTIGSERRTLILKARQLGISWVCCAYVLWLCLFHPGQVVILLSKGQPEANELLRRVKAMYHRLPPWMRAAHPRTHHQPDSNTEFGWSNGSVVRSMPATKGAGRSFTASLVVMDEAAWMVYAREVFTAAEPTMEAGGKLIVLSTANGASGLFHSLWQGAVRGANQFRAVFLPWSSRPSRTPEWYAEKLAKADDPATVKQEYPETATEAFLASGRVRFPQHWVDPQAAHALPELAAELWPESLGPLDGMHVWEAPVADRAYLVIADVAEGRAVEGRPAGDYCAAVVVEAETFKEVACLHGRWEPDEFGRRLSLMGGEYGRCPVVVERNNHGHAVLLKLALLEYPAIARGPDGHPGWLTNAQTKPQMIDALAGRLRDGRIMVRFAPALGEIALFRVLDNGQTSAPSGEHDDLVMAWAVGAGWKALVGDHYMEFL